MCDAIVIVNGIPTLNSPAIVDARDQQHPSPALLPWDGKGKIRPKRLRNTER
jgi:hypothetical protein